MEVANWKKYKLGDIVTLHYGKSLVSNKRVHGKIPVYSSAGITGWHNEALMDSPSVIIGRKGTVGSVYYNNQPFYCIDTAYYILPDESYDLKFIYYLLQTIGLEDLNEDSAVPGLNRNTAYSQNILIPDLPTQTRIAKILSSLDDKIALNRQMNQTLEDMAQTLFKKYFVDDIDEENLPEGWRIGKVGELLSFRNGKSSPIRSLLGKYPVYGANGVIGNANEYNSYKKNIIIGRVGSFCGSLYYSLQNSFVTENAIIGESKMECSSSFCFILLKELNLNDFKGGSGQPLINQTVLSSIKVIIPDYSLIIGFENVVITFYERIHQNKIETEELVKFRDTLLPKLLSGELSIDTADTIITNHQTNSYEQIPG